MLERAHDVQHKVMSAVGLDWRNGSIWDMCFSSLIKILQLLFLYKQSHQKSKYSLLVIFTQREQRCHALVGID